MRVSHGFTANFDDPCLVSSAGLAPVLQLAERAGLQRLVAEHVSIGEPGGANAHVKIPSLVAGMVAGADSIEDMGLLRHGGMGRLFAGVRAPSTLGTFLRSFTFGHVRQLDAVAARLLTGPAGRAPLLPAAAELVYVDIDDTVRRTYGYAKQGAGRGYTGVNGLNALIAVLSTPGSAPVIAATRLRKGATHSARGAARLVSDALVTAKAAGASGVRVLRGDSAFYSHDVITAAGRRQARFSITARQDRAVRGAIATIDARAWTPIRYPHAIFDADQQRWISDAEVAEIPYTAFTFPVPRSARDRPADRAPSPRPQPGQPERAVHRLTAATRCSPTPHCRCSLFCPLARWEPESSGRWSVFGCRGLISFHVPSTPSTCSRPRSTFSEPEFLSDSVRGVRREAVRPQPCGVLEGAIGLWRTRSRDTSVPLTSRWWWALSPVIVSFAC